MKEYSMYLMSHSKGAVHYTSYRSPPSFLLLKARYSFESKRNFTLIKTSEILQPQKETVGAMRILEPVLTSRTHLSGDSSRRGRGVEIRLGEQTLHRVDHLECVWYRPSQLIYCCVF